MEAQGRLARVLTVPLTIQSYVLIRIEIDRVLLRVGQRDSA